MGGAIPAHRCRDHRRPQARQRDAGRVVLLRLGGAGRPITSPLRRAQERASVPPPRKRIHPQRGCCTDHAGLRRAGGSNRIQRAAPQAPGSARIAEDVRRRPAGRHQKGRLGPGHRVAGQGRRLRLPAAQRFQRRDRRRPWPRLGSWRLLMALPKAHYGHCHCCPSGRKRRHTDTDTGEADPAAATAFAKAALADSWHLMLALQCPNASFLSASRSRVLTHCFASSLSWRVRRVRFQKRISHLLLCALILMDR